MTRERFEQVERHGAWVDLSARAKWRLAGADRVRYLNGQVTNDVRKASRAAAILACVTDVKGRIVGDVFIRESPDGASFLLDAEADLREALAARLERYIVADDVEIEDVADHWRLWHRVAPSGASATHEDFNAGDGFVCEAWRFGDGGLDCWIPASGGSEPGAVPEFVRRSLNAPCLDAPEAETLRILRGIPRWPAELGEGAFPPEAGLEARAMDFAKGCYIGQEILSRMRTTGRMPRTLVRWEAAGGGVAIKAGEQLFREEDGGAWSAIGRITSAAAHPVTFQQTGLAYVKQGSADAHSRLLVGADVPRIEARVNISQISR